MFGNRFPTVLGLVRNDLGRILKGLAWPIAHGFERGGF